MARSIWKGPFVDGYLLKKAENSRNSGRSEIIKILESTVDDLAAIRRSDVRRLQRP